MVRLHDPRQPISQVKQDTICVADYDYRMGTWNVTEDRIRRAKVIVCTCSAAALLRVYKNITFSHIFTDEAGQALITENLIPLSFASCGDSDMADCNNKQKVLNGKHYNLLNFNTKILLVGDPQQLGKG